MLFRSSTAGGIKVNRLVLAGKMMRTRLRQQQHPNAIIRIRLDGVIQENEALHAVMIFIVTYLMFILAGTVFGTMPFFKISSFVSIASPCT